MHLTTLTTRLFLGLALVSAANAGPGGEEIRWDEGAYAPGLERGLEGRLGRLTVPERHGEPNGPTIELAFCVYPTEHPDPGPPIYFLVGGPGGSGAEWGTHLAADERFALLERHDVVGIDQRGTGASLPNLADAPSFAFELPLDRVATRADFVEAFAASGAECAAHWAERGVDLAAYNTRESADDLDAIRRALGHEQIIPWGTSYGSHLGLAYIRRHGEHVARAFLSRVEGPDHTWKLPSAQQRVLDELGRLVAADEGLSEGLPDLVGTVRGLLERLAEDPVRIPLPPGAGNADELVVGPLDLQRIIAGGLDSPRGMAGLPRAIHALANGDWGPMAPMFVRLRDDEVGSAMTYAMDCASGISAERAARLERELADPANLLGDAIAAPFYRETCSGCGEVTLDGSFRAAPTFDGPVLFVSGSLDIRTPPENVEEILGGFPRATHLVIENASHSTDDGDVPELVELVHAFLAGEPISARRLALPPPRLAPLRTR